MFLMCKEKYISLKSCPNDTFIQKSKHAQNSMASVCVFRIQSYQKPSQDKAHGTPHHSILLGFLTGLFCSKKSMPTPVLKSRFHHPTTADLAPATSATQQQQSYNSDNHSGEQVVLRLYSHTRHLDTYLHPLAEQEEEEEARCAHAEDAHSRNMC